MHEVASLPDGRVVHAISLRGGGLRATVLTLGVTVCDLRLDGTAHPLVLGCANIADYLTHGRYVGSVVGRYANRIAGARFELDGQAHQLDANFRDRHILHGGSDGVDGWIWQVRDIGVDRVIFELSLPDGHMGFPGNLQIVAELSLQDGALCFDFSAVADKATPCSLAHHGFFNLDGGKDICDHELRIDAESYLPVDDDLIPLADPSMVRNGRFDFRAPKRIGGDGYDHNFCLRDSGGECPVVAELSGKGGLVMQVETDARGLQLYDGAHFDGLRGIGGRVYGRNAGLALETQHWPDAPNRSDFPDAILRPGQTYRHRVNYRFQQRAPRRS
ncbi:galactose mutarotase [Paracoccus sp. Z330]|uniref:Aldose 1-epimerase n=1 Tax=Paracoccus onchidii TaxID=3017813 RepID=A0ABT4ZCE2_9RHOB|nr:aldose epimerase family protein [Paracoccus onchidii]MDB6176386.1 galactose mutarotase [Paracoccus onchidii]